MDTQELRRLHGAATVGPYSVITTPENDVKVMAFDPESPAFPWHVATVEWDCDESTPHDNAAAIVALHNAAPALFDGFDLMRDALLDIVENSTDIGAVDTARAAIAALAGLVGEG
jgi:hypothetical protein